MYEDVCFCFSIIVFDIQSVNNIVGDTRPSFLSDTFLFDLK